MEKSGFSSAPAPYTSSSDSKFLSNPPTTTFASLSMDKDDRLRLLNFPPATIQAVRDTINATWPRGVQSEQDCHGSHEFKLRGHPWYGLGDDAVFARRLMCRVLETMANSGWALSLATTVARWVTEKDTLLFRYQPGGPPATTRCDWMVVSFSKLDLVRFIDAPTELVHYMVPHLEAFTQRHRNHSSQEGAYEFKIKGYPWCGTGKTEIEARKLVLRLLEGLHVNGWTVYASVRQKSGTTSESTTGENDTWHCCRPVTWSPGLPVYHL